MKQQAIQYLAMDVHQATVVTSLRDESGKVLMRATVRTEAKAILTLVRSAGPRMHVAFEEGTQAQWLHVHLPRAWPATLCAVMHGRPRRPGVGMARARKRALMRSITLVESSTREL